MDEKTRKMICIIMTDKVPMMIESGDKVYIVSHISTNYINGFVYDNKIEHMSEFKFSVIKTKSTGERYVMADRKRFNINKMKPCEIPIEVLIGQIEMLKRSDEERADYYIDNIQRYIERNCKAQIRAEITNALEQLEYKNLDPIIEPCGFERYEVFTSGERVGIWDSLKQTFVD